MLLPSCCGLEWLAASPHLQPGSAANIMCGNRSLASFPAGQSICPCKQWQLNQDPGACYGLWNYTALQGSVNCSSSGCPVGQRLYTTGSAIQCSATQYKFDLYETSCQECAVPNCNVCISSLTGCDQCLSGTRVLRTTANTSCVALCPSGYFPADNQSECMRMLNCFNRLLTSAACTTSCSSCSSSEVCFACNTGYGLLQNRCYRPCPQGFGLAAGQCVECSTALQGSLPVGCSARVTNPAAAGSTPLAAILVPVLIGFAMLVAGALWMRRRFRHTATSLTEKLLATEQEMQQYESEVEKYRRAWQIAAGELDLTECIGRGAVGEVFLGRWRDMAVAVKTIRGAWMSSEEMARELDHEASVLLAVRHAHVVQFFGAGTLADGTPFMVTELMELGTLTGVLLNPGTVLDWITRQRFARETALGMALVHSLGRMHRDLKSNNILVTGVSGTMRVKVADFGTATLATLAGSKIDSVAQTTERADAALLPTLVERAGTLRTKGVGTPLWMAPELLAGKHYDHTADVYSFGVVMWEIAARAEPWVEVQGTFIIAELLARISAEERPAVGAEWPVHYVAVMRRCWATEAAERPSFTEVTAMLEEQGRRGDTMTRAQWEMVPLA